MTLCGLLITALSAPVVALCAVAGGVAPALGASPSVAGAFANQEAGRRQERPWNIVFFLVDDIADPEVSCYDARYVATPHIDALAKTGLKFETCFATPLCQPSRVEMLTGRYAFRTGFYHHWGAPREPLVPKNVILTQLLQQAGYRTFIAGNGKSGSSSASPATPSWPIGT